MPDVHETAVVDSRAQLSSGVVVGPYAVVGPDVVLGDDVRVGAHVVIEGRTRIGPATRIHPFACLGGPPQDTVAEGDDPADPSIGLEIGKGNVLREHVTIHVGTAKGRGRTRIGDHSHLMNTVHVAHDCEVGSHCVLANFSGLAGHVSIGDHAVLGAYTGVHQHGRVGESVMAASGTKLSLDAPPFALVAGDRARLMGVNHVGLKRRGYSRERLQQIKRAFHLCFHAGLRLEEALTSVREELKDAADVERLLAFLETSERGCCRP
ncbi:MAG: acyl-ACP--UDP-N-acetylglucosamine O-acyltransferase [Myxococcota bacterium]|nr:acyl-ACP--UDP-N-acetylglucosamine O-acyltransferase [Myxococcota bacterium]